MLMKELLTVLDNNDEPFGKRLKIADNAFKSSELPLPHKEAILLNWILKHHDCNKTEIWDLLTNWMNSDQFNLNRNDIDTEEIISIVGVVKETLVRMETSDHFTIQKICNSLLLLLENGIFQQYFRYNIAVYCELISHILDKIQCSIYFAEFLKRDIFYKNVVTEDKFHKHFLELIVPTLAKCLIRFKDDRVFQEISKVVQKCIFYRNHKNFTIYINQFFENNKIEKQTIPKALIKYLLDVYKVDLPRAAITYKLILHAFCYAYDADFELLYKFFILLVHIIGFNLRDKLIFHKMSKLEISEPELSLNNSQELLLELLDVLSENKNNLDCKVKETTLSDFIRNIMRQLLYFNAPSATCYKIFTKAIVIDPLVIEPITDCIIIYAMMADNEEKREEYENLIISIFEVYSKMHRIENLVTKVVSTLNHAFNGTTEPLREIYGFKGKRDVNILIMQKEGFKIDNIFTENILEYFTKCICSLASWQMINIFKTLLHFLQKVLGHIHKIGNDNLMYFTYMEILSVFIGTFLCSIRIAEHTVATNVVGKSLKELEELRGLLKQFGLALLNKEHIHTLMRSFLNIAYYWGEIYIMLEYYSTDDAVEIKKSLDNDFTTCNITYLHSYLNIQQWCLISERISNFGELPCKILVQKLYIQKLRAMLLFEKKVNSDVVSNILRTITANLENNWKDILQDKYVINNLLQKMDSASITFLAESVVNNVEGFGNFHRQPHILNSSLLLTAINYVTIKKINKLLLKRKRRISENVSNAVSTNISSLFKDDKFLNDETLNEIVEQAKKIYHSENGNSQKNIEWRINEEKMNDLFKILRKFPVIYSSETVQKIYLLYLCSLHKDFSCEFENGNYKKLQESCEMLIIGILQQCKFKLMDIFDLRIFCKEIIRSYDEWKQIFSLVTENVFKCENSITEFGPLVHDFTEKLLDPEYMHCCIIIINAVIKLKKNKMDKDIKNTAEKYKTLICDTILKFVSKTKPEPSFINGYAWALRTFLSQNENEKLSKLLNSLNSYVDCALKNTANSECGNLMLIITILQNKSRLKLIDDDFPQRVWDAYKINGAVYSRFEEYSQLIVLIFGSVPNEKFASVTTDLLNITEKSISMGDLVLFGMHLKSWESILSCNLNPIKIKMLSDALERLLEKVVSILQYSSYDKELYESIFKFQKTLIQTVHLLLTPPMIDMLILNVKLLMHKEDQDFENIYNLSVSSLECLLRCRKPLIMDRLPPYLQQYRIILSSLCRRSNSDLNLEDLEIAQLSNCAHQLEKLTKNLISCQRDMGRIAMYLVADILEQYELITIYPNIKIHLNNCIYSLISICDQHAVAYLMRVLSSASTEIFKIMYENYKKYYRFTGKV